MYGKEVETLSRQKMDVLPLQMILVYITNSPIEISRCPILVKDMEWTQARALGDRIGKDSE